MKGRINEYHCENGHKTITKDIDEGVTSMMIECKQDGCKEFAKSVFYQCEQNQEHTHEWRKATDEQVKDFRYHPLALQHVLNGGLVLNEKTKKDA